MSPGSPVSVRELIDRGVLAVSDGYRTKKSEHGRPGFRIIRVADVLDDIVKLDSPDFVAEKYGAQVGAKLAQPGDVILTTKGTVGRVAIMPATAEAVVYSPQLCFFRVMDRSVLHPRFLRYWFSSPAFRIQASHRMNNTDMAAYINLADIRSLHIDLPVLDSQRAIAEVLGALDDKITANLGLAHTVEELLATEFAAMRIDEESVNPDAAIRIPLRVLVELNPAVPRPSAEESVYVDMQKLPVSGMSITDWTTRPVKGGTRFKNGDTLLARITPCLENRKTGYVDFLGDGQVAIGSTEYIVLRSRPHVPAELSYFLAISERFRSFAIRHMVGTSGRQRVAASDLADFRVNSPDPAHLEAFGRKSEALFALVKSQCDENRTLSRIRDGLLPQLMSGKIRVKDAEKTVEEVL